jgi:hypothetical protein
MIQNMESTPIEYKGHTIEVKRWEYYPGKRAWYATIDGHAQESVSFEHYAVQFAKEKIDRDESH